MTLVNSVTASVSGVSCGDCDARLEGALGSGFDAADITIAPAGDRVVMEFERSGSPFSSASFRQAVARVGGEVRALQIDACGTIDADAAGAWLASGTTRLLLEGAPQLDKGVEVCIMGELHDEETPARLLVVKRGS